MHIFIDICLIVYNTFIIYRFIKLKNQSGWKDPQEVSSPTSCWKQSQLQDQTKLLRAL